MCGDLQVDRWSSSSGHACSTYFIHPGLQLVIIGSTACFPLSAAVSLSSSSLPSSIIVRSAAKFVSNTSSNPSSLSAVAILPVTSVPGSSPHSSPRSALTAGAVLTISLFLLSKRAFQTASVESFSCIAPTGQTVVHWPQSVQLTVLSASPSAGPTIESKPLF